LTLLVSRGVPMLLGGDECRRTQRGNNNAYCHDDDTGWYDWNLLLRHSEVFRFTRGVIAFRSAHPVLSEETFYAAEDIDWFGPDGGAPRWGDPTARQCGCSINEGGRRALCLMFNAGTDAVDFALPTLSHGARWHVAMDTGCDSPRDLFAPGEEPPWRDARTYHLEPRASAVLLARRQSPQTGAK
jgi:isoamylase